MWTKEKTKEYNKNYYLANSGPIKKRASDWATKNTERRKIISKKYILNNPNKRAASQKKYNTINERSKRNHNYKIDFGITIDDYETLHRNQNGKCGICSSNVPNAKGRKHLFVDHNHITGAIRGLLCNRCNTALGLLKTDELGIANLEKAIQYLKKEVTK